MDHSHGPEAAMSDEADPLYRPLGPLEPWAAAPVDAGAWAEAVGRLRSARAADPAWGGMVGRGMLLAAAHRSGALDGMHGGDPEALAALLRGEALSGAVGPDARAHVRANAAAMRLARHADVSEGSICAIHEAACRPQLTHRVRVDDRVQDHVLAAGAYKHHPNHVFAGPGHWHATAPVAQVPAEMAGLVARVRSPAFADLHPVAQAAYLQYALLHVQPFADGNGRVARALAGGCHLRAASMPFLPVIDQLSGGPAEQVDIVQRAGIALVDLVVSVPRAGPALDRWRAQDEAGAALRRRLTPAVAEALDRHRRRPDRRADLGAAVVLPGRTVVVRVALDPRPAVEETITVEAHTEEDDGPVLLTAAEAGLRLQAAPGADLGPWLDHVVSILALRVAAELE